VGCGPSGLKTSPVTGKVTIDGQPAVNCRIDFQPIHEANQVASGQIAEDGSYTLLTGVSGTPGAMVGKYKVVLVPMGGDMAMGDEEPDYMSGSADPTAGPESEEPGMVPKEYMSAETTPKEVEVTSGANTINIDIQSAASADSDSSASTESDNIDIQSAASADSDSG